MVDKIFHEKLREEAEKEESNGSEICMIQGMADRYRFLISPEDARKLADEIERYYIPRPRFEDGEPAQWGDEFRGYSGEVCDLASFSVNLDGFYMLNCSCEDYDFTLRDSKATLKRPKVIDVDGVEIKPGDTVYYISTGRELKVLSPYGHGQCTHNLVDCYGFSPEPTELTHEKPVFDADGVRICKGDTVWHVEGSNLWRVVEIDNDAKAVTVEDPLASHDTAMFDASRLTHQEPDSLDRILDDATKDPRIYYNDHIGHDVGLQDDATVIQFFAQHLIGRTLALAENAASAGHSIKAI